MRKPFGMAAVIGAVALTAHAITEAEYNADPSLIPAATASSPFYIVAPATPSAEQGTDAYAMGLDSTPTEREYDFAFDTELTTHPAATVMYVR